MTSENPGWVLDHNFKPKESTLWEVGSGRYTTQDGFSQVVFWEPLGEASKLHPEESREGPKMS
jgi:hypothetical protein